MSILYLILLIIGIAILINYWKFIVASIAITIALFVLFLLITYALQKQKIRKIRQSGVILIPSQTIYGIPIEVEKLDYTTKKGKKSYKWIVKSIRPELNNSNLNFVELDYELAKVKIIESEPDQDSKYKTTKQISSLTKEIFCKIDPQLSKFEQQDSELERLEQLVLSSEIYRSKAQLYTRARVQIQQLIQQTEDLKQEYSRFIREILIGAELSRFEPSSMPDVLERKLTLHSKYEAISSEFQDLKIEIEAHTDLSMQSSV